MPVLCTGSIADAGIREQTTGAGEATVEAAPRPTALGTGPGQQPTPADGRRGRTPGTSQLRPARQLQFPSAQGPDDGDDGVPLF